MVEMEFDQKELNVFIFPVCQPETYSIYSRNAAMLHARNFQHAVHETDPKYMSRR